MRLKKVLAAGIAAAMTAGMLAGCGSGGSENTSDATTSGEGQNEAGTGTESAAASSDEIVTLKWVTIGNGMPTNYDSWVAKVNEYVGEKIGVNIEMEVIKRRARNGSKHGLKWAACCCTGHMTCLSDLVSASLENLVRKCLTVMVKQSSHKGRVFADIMME